MTYWLDLTGWSVLGEPFTKPPDPEKRKNVVKYVEQIINAR